jgi:diaminopimelate decarboxylase
METDRLADGIALPSDLEIGEVLAILDAGAYDASMAYRFARGGSRAR